MYRKTDPHKHTGLTGKCGTPWKLKTLLAALLIRLKQGQDGHYIKWNHLSLAFIKFSCSCYLLLLEQLHCMQCKLLHVLFSGHGSLCFSFLFACLARALVTVPGLFYFTRKYSHFPRAFCQFFVVAFSDFVMRFYLLCWMNIPLVSMLHTTCRFFWHQIPLAISPQYKRYRFHTAHFLQIKAQHAFSLLALPMPAFPFTSTPIVHSIHRTRYWNYSVCDKIPSYQILSHLHKWSDCSLFGLHVSHHWC